jgi:hypothetical protein
LKKYALLSLITAIIILLAGCALDPFEQYENFIMDMDINSRFEEAFYFVNRGDTSPFFISNVEALYYDLENYNEGDVLKNAPEAEDQIDPGDINQYYLDSAKLLLRAIDKNKEDKPQLAQLELEQALDKYRDAQELYAQFLQQYGRKNR